MKEKEICFYWLQNRSHAQREIFKGLGRGSRHAGVGETK
jgi:hypothetical protein